MQKEQFHWVDQEGKPHPYSGYDAYYFPDEFATMVDYAVNYMKYDPEEFMTAFLKSEIPLYIEYGFSQYISGMDGIEICIEIERDVLHVDVSERQLVQNTDYCQSETIDFWFGRVLALSPSQKSAAATKSAPFWVYLTFYTLT